MKREMVARPEADFIATLATREQRRTPVQALASRKMENLGWPAYFQFSVWRPEPPITYT